ncbi:uncharacterized protein PHA67_002682 [Liasis olivaceus]
MWERWQTEVTARRIPPAVPGAPYSLRRFSSSAGKRAALNPRLLVPSRNRRHATRLLDQIFAEICTAPEEPRPAPWQAPGFPELQGGCSDSGQRQREPRCRRPAPLARPSRRAIPAGHQQRPRDRPLLQAARLPVRPAGQDRGQRGWGRWGAAKPREDGERAARSPPGEGPTRGPTGSGRVRRGRRRGPPRRPEESGSGAPGRPAPAGQAPGQRGEGAGGRPAGPRRRGGACAARRRAACALGSARLGSCRARCVAPLIVSPALGRLSPTPTSAATFCFSPGRALGRRSPRRAVTPASPSCLPTRRPPASGAAASPAQPSPAQPAPPPSATENAFRALTGWSPSATRLAVLQPGRRTRHCTRADGILGRKEETAGDCIPPVCCQIHQ